VDNLSLTPKWDINSFQNLEVNCESLSDRISEGRPCNRQISFAKAFANSDTGDGSPLVNGIK
jgi:hypothetical protein